MPLSIIIHMGDSPIITDRQFMQHGHSGHCQADPSSLRIPKELNLTLTESMGNMTQCSAMPASAPAKHVTDSEAVAGSDS